MEKVFALVDCNNFYVSCERAFRPDIRTKPVIVLSNNDGCVVSRSNEAKSLGISMGVPYFKIQNEIRKYGIEVFSSNYALYADMSARVMQTLAGFTPKIEVYSIDEAFLGLEGILKDIDEYGRRIRQTVTKWTGIPVSVGIAQTKTLAKLANHIAKKSNKAHGVLNLKDSPYLKLALERTPVNEVWGIGRRIAARLEKVGIRNALQLSEADEKWIQKQFGVVGLRTVYELRGICCYELDQEPPLKKGITVSRSFGNDVETLEELQEALASYANRAGEKLRQEKEAAAGASFFAMTNRFDPQSKYYKCVSVDFGSPTCNSVEIVHSATQAAKKLFKAGAKFKKAGVMLWGLIPENQIQLDLFETRDRGKEKRLMEALDNVNVKAKGAVRFAVEGKEQNWKTKFEHRSRKYTTSWDDLPQVK